MNWIMVCEQGGLTSPSQQPDNNNQLQRQILCSDQPQASDSAVETQDFFLLSHVFKQAHVADRQVNQKKGIIVGSPEQESELNSVLVGWKEDDNFNRLRFSSELEFVQSLANPQYLRHLCLEGYMDDPRFISYLHYLTYWKHKPYIFYIRFPICLRVIDWLIESKTFRKALFSEEIISYLEQTIALQWLNYNLDIGRKMPEHAFNLRRHIVDISSSLTSNRLNVLISPVKILCDPTRNAAEFFTHKYTRPIRPFIFNQQLKHGHFRFTFCTHLSSGRRKHFTLCTHSLDGSAAREVPKTAEGHSEKIFWVVKQELEELAHWWKNQSTTFARITSHPERNFQVRKHDPTALMNVRALEYALRRVLELPLTCLETRDRIEYLRKHRLINALVRNLKSNLSRLSAIGIRDALILHLLTGDHQDMSLFNESASADHAFDMANYLLVFYMANPSLEILLPFSIFSRHPYFALQKALWKNFITTIFDNIHVSHINNLTDDAVLFAVRCMRDVIITHDTVVGCRDTFSSGKKQNIWNNFSDFKRINLVACEFTWNSRIEPMIWLQSEFECYICRPCLLNLPPSCIVEIMILLSQCDCLTPVLFSSCINHLLYKGAFITDNQIFPTLLALKICKNALSIYTHDYMGMRKRRSQLESLHDFPLNNDALEYITSDGSSSITGNLGFPRRMENSNIPERIQISPEIMNGSGNYSDAEAFVDDLGAPDGLRKLLSYLKMGRNERGCSEPAMQDFSNRQLENGCLHGLYADYNTNCIIKSPFYTKSLKAVLKFLRMRLAYRINISTINQTLATEMQTFQSQNKDKYLPNTFDVIAEVHILTGLHCPSDTLRVAFVKKCSNGLLEAASSVDDWMRCVEIMCWLGIGHGSVARFHLSCSMRKAFQQLGEREFLRLMSSCMHASTIHAAFAANTRTAEAAARKGLQVSVKLWQRFLEIQTYHQRAHLKLSAVVGGNMGNTCKNTHCDGLLQQNLFSNCDSFIVNNSCGHTRVCFRDGVQLLLYMHRSGLLLRVPEALGIFFTAVNAASSSSMYSYQSPVTRTADAGSSFIEGQTRRSDGLEGMNCHLQKGYRRKDDRTLGGRGSKTCLLTAFDYFNGLSIRQMALLVAAADATKMLIPEWLCTCLHQKLMTKGVSVLHADEAVRLCATIAAQIAGSLGHISGDGFFSINASNGLNESEQVEKTFIGSNFRKIVDSVSESTCALREPIMRMNAAYQFELQDEEVIKGKHSGQGYVQNDIFTIATDSKTRLLRFLLEEICEIFSDDLSAKCSVNILWAAAVAGEWDIAQKLLHPTVRYWIETGAAKRSYVLLYEALILLCRNLPADIFSILTYLRNNTEESTRTSLELYDNKHAQGDYRNKVLSNVQEITSFGNIDRTGVLFSDFLKQYSNVQDRMANLWTNYSHRMFPELYSRFQSSSNSAWSIGSYSEEGVDYSGKIDKLLMRSQKISDISGLMRNLAEGSILSRMQLEWMSEHKVDKEVTDNSIWLGSILPKLSASCFLRRFLSAQGVSELTFSPFGGKGLGPPIIQATTLFNSLDLNGHRLSIEKNVEEIALGGWKFRPLEGAEHTPDWGSSYFNIGILVINPETELLFHSEYNMKQCIQNRRKHLLNSLSKSEESQVRRELENLLDFANRVHSCRATRMHHCAMENNFFNVQNFNDILPIQREKTYAEGEFQESAFCRWRGADLNTNGYQRNTLYSTKKFEGVCFDRSTAVKILSLQRRGWLLVLLNYQHVRAFQQKGGAEPQWITAQLARVRREAPISPYLQQVIDDLAGGGCGRHLNFVDYGKFQENIETTGQDKANCSNESPSFLRVHENPMEQHQNTHFQFIRSMLFQQIQRELMLLFHSCM